MPTPEHTAESGEAMAGMAARHSNAMARLQAFAEINSGTHNHQGIARAAEFARGLFAELDCRCTTLPGGQAITGSGQSVTVAPGLSAVRYPDRPVDVLLNGHLDTVFDRDHPFQQCTFLPDGRLKGPAVADMKGGIIVMHEALRALQQCPQAKNLNWKVLLTTDEEIGSPFFAKILTDEARKAGVGLIFESSPPEGHLVKRRMGSSHIRVEAIGREAHVGRAFAEGRNAPEALAELVVHLRNYARAQRGLILNLGQLAGGGPLNIVPGSAVAEWNARSFSGQTIEDLHREGARLAGAIGTAHQCRLDFSAHRVRPPKVVDERGEAFCRWVESVAAGIGQSIAWQDTGGGSDGSSFSAGNLPNIDNLGVIGGNLHTAEEFMFPESLLTRARLTFRILLGIATGGLPWEGGNR